VNAGGVTAYLLQRHIYHHCHSVLEQQRKRYAALFIGLKRIWGKQQLETMGLQSYVLKKLGAYISMVVLEPTIYFSLKSYYRITQAHRHALLRFASCRYASPLSEKFVFIHQPFIPLLSSKDFRPIHALLSFRILVSLAHFRRSSSAGTALLQVSLLRCCLCVYVSDVTHSLSNCCNH
jgi:hypothetical protein